MIRKAAGIELPGWDPSTTRLITEVEIDEEPELGLRGGGGIGRADGGSVRLVLTEQHPEHTRRIAGIDPAPRRPAGATQPR